LKRRDTIIVLLIFAFPLFYSIRDSYVVDDAFITFRYARNFCQGAGLVFNPGERVEGYTNFLWTLMMTPAFWLGTDPLLFSRIVSAAAGLATLIFLVRFSRSEAGKTSYQAFVAPVLLAAHASYSTWLLAGMETHLFTFFVTAGMLSFFRHNEDRRGAWPVLFVLASLTRPEGLLFLVIAWVRSAAGSVKKKSFSLKGSLHVTIPFLLLFVPYLIWKSSYYGALVPNTFHAKVGSEISQLWRGLLYMKYFLQSSGWFLFLLPLLLLGSGKGRHRLKDILLFVVPYCAYVILVGGDVMVKFRFLLPVLPVLYVLIAEALFFLSSLSARKVGSGLILAGLTAAAVFFTVDFDRSLVRKRKQMVMDWIETGKWIGTNYPDDTAIALGSVGAIPYYSNMHTIDIFGLTEPRIARTTIEGMGKGLPGHEKADGAYVLSRKPDLIFPKVVLTEEPPDRGTLGELFMGSRAERQIWLHPAFSRDYFPVTVKLSRGHLTFFARRE